MRNLRLYKKKLCNLYKLPIFVRTIKSSGPRSVANLRADTKLSYRNLLENAFVEYRPDAKMKIRWP
jgi:hypothetical protein